jgi:hypothetical protein
MIIKNLRKLKIILKEWMAYFPISKRDYFNHSILILDCIFIISRISYQSLFSYSINIGFILFDFLVALIWTFDLFKRLKTKENKIEYLKTRWYKVLGLVPFPSFRLLLLLGTLKLIIITYKYIKRGEKNKELFLDREINFRFQDLIVDAVSDAIFLKSLERVEEVTKRLDFSEIAKKIMSEHRSELKKAVQVSLNSKTVVAQIKSFPFMSTLTDQLSEDVTELIIETIEMEVTGKILKETNLHVLKEMNMHVLKLDLDRITSTEENENFLFKKE